MTDTDTKSQPTLTLNDGRRMPQLGFGTWKLKGEEATSAVRNALDAGYWLVDTAAIYENEEYVGRGIGDWSDIFLQTKVWNNRQGFDEAKAACRESLKKLGRDHVDMLLIHWPCPEKNLYVETWKAFVELREEGLAKSIGVSNFRADEMKRIADATGVMPALNQIELHPGFQQRELRVANAELGVVTQSWSPLGQSESLSHPVIATVAREVDQPAGAVVLRWHMQHGLCPIPKSATPAHIADNLRALSFELSEDQMARIDTLDDPEGRMGEHPDNVN